MSTPHTPTPDADFLDRLIAYEEARSSGDASIEPPSDERERWEGALRCLDLLDALREQSASPTTNPALTRLGKFRLLRELGQGGFGTVHLAEDEWLHRQVALKVPHISTLLSHDARSRFLREAQLTATLTHPHLVPVLEAGEADGLCYIASLYCPGVNLQQWLRAQSSACPPREAAQLIATLADAVQHAHDKEIVHRDIKPSNILLSPPDGVDTTDRPLSTYLPRITDFGLARSLDDADHLTRTHIIIGTPAYLAPEQAEGKHDQIGVGVDIWSLGIVLYELLTGHRPFEGQTDLETLDRIRHAEPVAPSQVRAPIPRDLESVCLRCLRRSPSERYRSAGELAADLQRFLRGEPTLARPISRRERFIKWVRRHPLPTAMIVLSCVSITTAVIGLILHNRRLSEAFTLAEERRTSAEQSEKRSRDQLYAADMLLAYRLVDEGDPFTAHEVLQRHRPQADEPDRRGFEWHLLAGQTQPDTPMFYIDANCWGTRLSYTPDGQRLAVATTHFPKERQPDVTFWNLDGTLHRRYTGYTGYSAVSPDGRLIALIESNDEVVIRDSESGAEIARKRFTVAKKSSFTTDSKSLIVITPYQLQRWYWQDGRTESLEPTNETIDGSYSEEIHHQGSVRERIAITPANGGLALWDIQQKQTIAELDTNRNAKPGYRCFIELAEQRFAATHGNGEAIIWNADGSVRHRIVIPSAMGLAATHDGQQIAVGDGTGTVHLIDVRSGETRRTYRWQSTPIIAIAFAPGDQEIAVLSANGQIRRVQIRRIDNSTVLRSPSHPLCMAFSPNNRTLAVAEPDQLRLIDVMTQQVRTLPIPSGPGTTMQFAPSNEHVLLLQNGECRMISLREGTTRPICNDPSIRCMAIRPDGNEIAVGTNAGEVQFIDPQSGSVRQRWSCAKQAILQIVYTFNGREIAITTNAELSLWRDAEKRSSQKLSHRPNALAWRDQPAQLAVALDRSQTHLWNVRDNRTLEPVTMHNQLATYTSSHIQFLADGISMFGYRAHAMCYGNPNSIRCRDLLDGDWLPTQMTMSANSDWIAAIDGTSLQLLRRGDWHCLHPLGPWMTAPRSLTPSADGQQIFIGFETPFLEGFRRYQLEGFARQLAGSDVTGSKATITGTTTDGWFGWNLRSGEAITKPSGEWTFAPPAIWRRNSTGSRWAGASWDGSVQLLDAEMRPLVRLHGSSTNEPLLLGWERARRLTLTLIKPATMDGITDCVFSPDGQELITLTRSRTLRRWSASDGRLLRETVLPDNGYDQPSGWLCYHPHESAMFIGRGSTVYRYAADTLELEQTWNRNGSGPQECGAISPDGRWLIGGARDGQIRVWDVRNGSEVEPLIGHRDAVRGVAFSPDGRTIASASQDKTVRLWNVASWREVGMLRGGTAFHQVIFNPDGQSLIAGCTPNAERDWLRIWRVGTLTDEQRP